MDPITDFFTLANVYNPSKAIDLQNKEADLPTNQLYNRVMQERYKNQLGQYQNLGEDTAFDQYMSNQGVNAINQQGASQPITVQQPPQASMNAMPNQNMAAIPQAPMQPPVAPQQPQSNMMGGIQPPAMAQGQVTPQNINALMSNVPPPAAPESPQAAPTAPNPAAQSDQPKPEQSNMIMTMRGPVDKTTIPQNLIPAAARSHAQYNQLAEQQEVQATQAEFGAIGKEIYGMITDTKPGDQDKLDKVRTYVEQKPRLLQAFKRSGLYQYMTTAELKPGGVNEAPHYFTQEELDKLPPEVKDPLRSPGWYTETSRYDRKTGRPMIEGMKPLTPSEDFLAQVIAAEGPDAKAAQRSLDIKQGMSTKTKTPEQLRSIFTDPNKPLDARNKAFQDYMLSNNTKEQLTALLKSPNLTPEMKSQALGVKTTLQDDAKQVAAAGAARVDARQERAREAGKESVDTLSDMLINKEIPTTSISDFKGKRSAAIAAAKAKDPNYNAASNDAEIRANTMSQTKLQFKQDTLEGAVNNVKGQVAKFKSMKPAGMQTNVLALNTMGNKFLSGFVGNVDKAKLDTIFQELSTEITKIASDSTGSVAQAAQGAKEKWDKIHNTNYRWKDAADLIGFIQELADVRFESGQTVLKGVKSRLRGDTGKTDSNKDPLGIR